MTVLRGDLLDAGAIAAGEWVEELHHREGDFGMNGSCRTPRGYAWFERAAERQPVAFARALVEELQRLLIRDPLVADLAAMPTVTSSGTAVYAQLSGHHLFADGLLRSDIEYAPFPPQLQRVCAKLGWFLARLHKMSSDAVASGALSKAHVAVRDVEVLRARARGAPPRSLAVERLQEALLVDYGDVSDALAVACEEFRSCAAPVVLHGQFSPGFVVLNDDGYHFQIIGWLEAAAGPPAFDVGWFCGELLELQRTWQAADARRAAAVGEALTAFLTAYESERATQLDFRGSVRRFSALKVVAHLHQYASYFAFPDDRLEPFLDVARAALGADVGQQK